MENNDFEQISLTSKVDKVAKFFGAVLHPVSFDRQMVRYFKDCKMLQTLTFLSIYGYLNSQTPTLYKIDIVNCYFKGKK